MRPHSTTLYKVATEEILKIGQMPPDLIAENYKKRDMNEYLRLLAKYGEIEEAVDVACGILEKATRKLTHIPAGVNLHENHLPVMTIEKLNYFTKLNNTELQARLAVKMEDYLAKLKDASRKNIQQVRSGSVY